MKVSRKSVCMEGEGGRGEREGCPPSATPMAYLLARPFHPTAHTVVSQSLILCPGLHQSPAKAAKKNMTVIDCSQNVLLTKATLVEAIEVYTRSCSTLKASCRLVSRCTGCVIQLCAAELVLGVSELASSQSLH